MTISFPLQQNWSLPARGARVEIANAMEYAAVLHRSLPSRGARVEIPLFMFLLYANISRSPRGERGLKLRIDQ